jgi:hypothetical protein
MFCVACGQQLLKNANFCSNCGIPTNQLKQDLLNISVPSAEGASDNSTRIVSELAIQRLDQEMGSSFSAISKSRFTIDYLFRDTRLGTLLNNLVSSHYKVEYKNWDALTLAEKIVFEERHIQAYRFAYPKVQTEVARYSGGIIGVRKATVEADFQTYGRELEKLEAELKRLIQLREELELHQRTVNSSNK